jgi:hypothetical protein
MKTLNRRTITKIDAFLKTIPPFDYRTDALPDGWKTVSEGLYEDQKKGLHMLLRTTRHKGLVFSLDKFWRWRKFCMKRKWTIGESAILMRQHGMRRFGDDPYDPTKSVPSHMSRIDGAATEQGGPR